MMTSTTPSVYIDLRKCNVFFVLSTSHSAYITKKKKKEQKKINNRYVQVDFSQFRKFSQLKHQNNQKNLLLFFLQKICKKRKKKTFRNEKKCFSIFIFQCHTLQIIRNCFRILTMICPTKLVPGLKIVTCSLLTDILADIQISKDRGSPFREIQSFFLQPMVIGQGPATAEHRMS